MAKNKAEEELIYSHQEWERKEIVHTSFISTLQLTIGQQKIAMRRVENQLETLQQIKILMQETDNG